MQLLLIILCGMVNSVDLPDQTAPSGAVCSGSALFAICICHFDRHFGVQNLRTFTIRPKNLKYPDF